MQIPCVVEQQDRDEHIREVVDDIVEPGAIEARKALFDARGPGEDPVRGIYTDTGGHPQERLAIVAAQNGYGRRKAHNSPGCREEVNGPRGRFFQGGRLSRVRLSCGRFTHSFTDCADRCRI
jgi:hypothetical protein